jgi:hypothetical protein
VRQAGVCAARNTTGASRIFRLWSFAGRIAQAGDSWGDGAIMQPHNESPCRRGEPRVRPQCSAMQVGRAIRAGIAGPGGSWWAERFHSGRTRDSPVHAGGIAEHCRNDVGANLVFARRESSPPAANHHRPPRIITARRESSPPANKSTSSGNVTRRHRRRSAMLPAPYGRSGVSVRNASGADNELARSL